MDKAEVFISYSWKEESEKIADELDASFRKRACKSFATNGTWPTKV